MKVSLLKLMSDYCFISSRDAHKLLEWYLGMKLYRGDVCTNLYQLWKDGLIERRKGKNDKFVYKLMSK